MYAFMLGLFFRIEKAASEKKAEAAMDVFDWMETDIYIESVQ